MNQRVLWTIALLASAICIGIPALLLERTLP